MQIKIKDGKLVDPYLFIDWAKKSKDGFYVISSWKKARTTDQNRYYRALIAIIQETTGTDKNEIHEMMRTKFLTTIGSIDGLPYCKSTTKLDTKEFSDYIENMKNFIAEAIGLVLPSADERVTFINNTEYEG